jgi:tetratricopeptide (TPR) repeat protein
MTISTLSGDIKTMSIPWFIQDLRTQKRTGTAVLCREKDKKKIFLRNGDIIFAASNLDTDQLGTSLLLSGMLTEEQRTTSEEVAKRTGKQLGAVLIERGLITPKDLVTGAKLQVKQIVLSLFSWREGSYEFENAHLPLAEIVPLQLDTGALLMDGIRSLEWKLVRKSLPPLKTVLRQAKDSAFLLKGITLDQDQQLILSLIDNIRCIEEICSLSEIGDFGTLKAIHALSALRLVESAGLKSVVAARESRQSIHADSYRQEAEVKVTKELILQTLGKIADLDYYQILDVGRGATAQEIKKAYFRLAKRYHPDKHIDNALSDMKEKLEIIFMSITEAYDVLTSEDKREAYDLSLVSGLKKQYPSDEIKTQQEDNKKRSALSQFNEGLKHYRGQNFWGAEEAFRWAVRLAPTNAEYLFHHGLALAHMPRRLHDAEEAFQKAIKMEPSKIEYYLELGNLYSRNGLKRKAQSVFQDALQRNPNSEKVKHAIKSING